MSTQDDDTQKIIQQNQLLITYLKNHVHF